MTPIRHEALSVRFVAGYTIQAGTYFRVHNVARGLRDRGHDVTVHAADPDAHAASRVETRDGVPYHIIPESGGLQYFGSASHPLTAARRAFAGVPRCDVLHAFQPFLEVAAPWYAARATRLRAFDWDDLWWGGAINAAPRGVADWWLGNTIRLLEQRMPRDATLVTTCSAYLASRAGSAGARSVGVVPNGFWPAPTSARGDVRRALRRGLGLVPDALYAGFMGRTAAELAWCAGAVEALRDREPTLRLAVCGPPPDVIATACSRIRDRVDYLGVLAPERVRDFAAALDIGLLPLEDNPFNQSRFPIKFAEYLGAGAPVVMSDVGECAELARTWPWVVIARAGEASFRDAFAGAVTRAAAHTLPEVDAVVVAAILGWDRIAENLEGAYLAALGSAH